MCYAGYSSLGESNFCLGMVCLTVLMFKDRTLFVLHLDPSVVNCSIFLSTSFFLADSTTLWVSVDSVSGAPELLKQLTVVKKLHRPRVGSSFPG